MSTATARYEDIRLSAQTANFTEASSVSSLFPGHSHLHTARDQDPQSSTLTTWPPNTLKFSCECLFFMGASHFPQSNLAIKTRGKKEAISTYMHHEQ